MKHIKDKKALEDLRWRLERFSVAFADLKSLCELAMWRLEQLKRARNTVKITNLRTLLRDTPTSLDVGQDEGVFEGSYRDDLDALESDILSILGPPLPSFARSAPRRLEPPKKGASDLP